MGYQENVFLGIGGLTLGIGGGYGKTLSGSTWGRKTGYYTRVCLVTRELKQRVRRESNS